MNIKIFALALAISHGLNVPCAAVAAASKNKTASQRRAGVASAKTVSYYFARGRSYCRTYNFHEAVDILSAGIKKYPRSANLYMLRAQAYAGLGQLQLQIDDLSAAIKSRPRSADLYTKRAVVYNTLRRFQLAIDDAKDAIKIDPFEPEAYRAAAAAYRDLEMYEKAIDSQTQLLRFNAKNALDWNDRAMMYQKIGKMREARVDWQKAISLATPGERETIQLCNPLLDFDRLGRAGSNVVDPTLKNTPVVLPFKFDPGGKICISAMVNGKPIQLMLDTGCRHSDLWHKSMPKVFEDRGLKIDRVVRAKNLKPGLVKVRELKLGGLTLSDFPMGLDEGLSDHKTLGGFLGGNFLENFVVTIDYSKKQVIFAAPSRYLPPQNCISVPLKVNQHSPYCAITLDETLRYEALVDTGSSSNLSADALLTPILKEPVAWSRIESGPWFGVFTVGDVKLKSLTVSTFNIKDPIVAVGYTEGAPHTAGSIYIGNEFLSRFKTATFDYPGRRLLLEPYETETKSALTCFAEAFYLASHDQLQRALESYRIVMTMESDFAESCLWERAIIFERLKDFKRAILELDELIKVNGDFLDAHIHRAQDYDELGDYERQIPDYTAIINLLQKQEALNPNLHKWFWEPRLVDAYAWRASVYDKIGKHQLAERDRKAADLLKAKAKNASKKK
ncbi:MAG: tetratricopeptide repeat protein [Candidatus Melainabacteria bacterium]|nr:tetratricopeptide repeat protein [Candidatus Melainabacteria bacterium]